MKTSPALPAVGLRKDAHAFLACFLPPWDSVVSLLLKYRIMDKRWRILASRLNVKSAVE